MKRRGFLVGTFAAVAVAHAPSALLPQLGRGKYIFPPEHYIQANVFVETHEIVEDNPGLVDQLFDDMCAHFDIKSGDIGDHPCLKYWQQRRQDQEVHALLTGGSYDELR